MLCFSSVSWSVITMATMGMVPASSDPVRVMLSPAHHCHCSTLLLCNSAKCDDWPVMSVCSFVLMIIPPPHCSSLGSRSPFSFHFIPSLFDLHFYPRSGLNQERTPSQFRSSCFSHSWTSGLFHHFTRACFPFSSLVTFALIIRYRFLIGLALNFFCLLIHTFLCPL